MAKSTKTIYLNSLQLPADKLSPLYYSSVSFDDIPRGAQITGASFTLYIETTNKNEPYMMKSVYIGTYSDKVITPYLGHDTAYGNRDESHRYPSSDYVCMFENYNLHAVKSDPSIFINGAYVICIRVDTWASSSEPMYAIQMDLTLEYTAPYFSWEDKLPTVSIKQNGPNIDIAWDPAVIIDGSGDIYYIVHCTGQYSANQWIDEAWETTDTTISIPTPVYDLNMNILITALCDDPFISALGYDQTFTARRSVCVMKCYINGGWQQATVKYFDGSNWKDCTFKYYDGTQWVECSF